MTTTAKHTPGPWEYVPSNGNHGPYVSNGWGAGDICDCYVMSKPSELAVCNGGASKPIPHQSEEADANARLIAAAPELLENARNNLVMMKHALHRLSIRDLPTNGLERAIRETEALIAKATGGAA